MREEGTSFAMQRVCFHRSRGRGERKALGWKGPSWMIKRNGSTKRMRPPVLGYGNSREDHCCERSDVASVFVRTTLSNRIESFSNGIFGRNMIFAMGGILICKPLLNKWVNYQTVARAWPDYGYSGKFVFL